MRNAQIFTKCYNFDENLQNNAKINKLLRIKLDDVVDLENAEK